MKYITKILTTCTNNCHSPTVIYNNIYITDHNLYKDLSSECTDHNLYKDLSSECTGELCGRCVENVVGDGEERKFA